MFKWPRFNAGIVALVLIVVSMLPFVNFHAIATTVFPQVVLSKADGTTYDLSGLGTSAEGAGTAATATRVVVASDDALIGPTNESACTTDTATCGLSGRLQRVAQRVTSLIALLPTALGGSGGLKVETQVATTGGPTMYSANVTTAGSGAGTGGVAVDASAGQVYGYAIYNGNSSVCYISFFDQTQALTNLGTTVAKMAIGIPANGGANLMSTTSIGAFATAITISATTTRAGSTACSTGLDINVWYK